MLNSQRAGVAPPHAEGDELSGVIPRRGSERLHFRACRVCRRCASDASYESVGNAGSIVVTTTDKSLVIV